MAEKDPKQPDIEPAAEAPESSPESVEDAAAAAEPEQAPEAEVAEAAAEDDPLAQLQDEVAQLKDVALRAQAEAQNAKRRAELDVEKARKFALEGFARELLPVVDNLERALESAAGDEAQVKAIAEGVELTLKSLQDALKRFNIVAVDPQGEPFDPQLHQAMSMVENPDVEPNTVIAVMQKGYTLNERLVRPAMVMVSKAAS
ncbi:nucleotide exchange factor GrpE [Parahaliea mediterranea]|uniref:nucleotide exchange factor GrpE n=1 Tax=Parahaliea mediterranea TaxID=651086 RepID=UPI000E2F679C|nr:nucleotide exchange factor GrpE [Parahaliea mediterranea]